MKRLLGFALAVALQVVIIAIVPWPQVRARNYGTDVVLATAQFDPYNPFSGHYIALRFEVEQVDADMLDRLPPVFYVGIRPDAAGIWRPVGAAAEPEGLPPATIAVKTMNRRWSTSIGIDRFYIPEERRVEINDALAAAQAETNAIRVRARIGPDGTAALLALQVRDHEYAF